MNPVDRYQIAITEDKPGPVYIVSLTGQIDPLAAAELQTSIDHAVSAGGRKFVLDLSELRYIGSVGLQVFISLANKVRADGAVAMANPDANIRSVLEVTKLTQRIPCYQTRGDAVDAVRSR